MSLAGGVGFHFRGVGGVVGSGTYTARLGRRGELEQSAVAGDDDVGPEGGVLDVEQDPASVTGEGGRDREQPQPFGLPPSGGMLGGDGEELGPGGQVGRDGLSNGRIESVNTKVRLITRIAFGFRSPEALIALAMLSLRGNKPALPGRT